MSKRGRFLYIPITDPQTDLIPESKFNLRGRKWFSHRVSGFCVPEITTSGFISYQRPRSFISWCLNSYRQLDPYSCYPKPTPITNNEEKTEQAFHKNGKNILWKSPVCRDLQCSLAQVFWISMTSSRCRAIRAGREKFQCIEGKTSWQAKIIAFSCCSVNYNRLVFIF